MDSYKFLDKHFGNKNNKNDNALIKYLKRFVSKLLICFILFLLLLIVIKINPKYKETIYKNVYEKNFSFAKINALYKKYFGSVLPFDNIVPDEKPVFSEKLVYKEASLYKDGVKLSVEEHYLVPILESGIVVFIGEKNDYGSTVIVQQINGVDVWYCNITIGDIKIYDYVEKSKMLGEVNGGILYLLFQKNGKFLDYKEYL